MKNNLPQKDYGTCERNINYIWLLDGAPAPSHFEIARFRSMRLAKCADEIFSQLVTMLHEMGEIEYEHLFVDGMERTYPMNKASELKQAFLNLFRSGANGEHDEADMEALLEGIDFSDLLHALKNRAEPVYKYRADNRGGLPFGYRGREMFRTRAVRLYRDVEKAHAGVAVSSHHYELWLLPDLTFEVTTCFRVNVGNGAYVTEYRSDQGRDWTKTDLCIDFVAFADELQALCRLAYGWQTPMYEL